MFTTIDARLFVEVADTPHKQAQGLMFVKNMPDNNGMLFVFNRQDVLSFWGENTFMPLDIAFADSDGIIQRIDKIAPMSRKAVSSLKPCKYAIEANDGYFDQNRINVGDKIKIEQDPLRGSFITFVRTQGRKDVDFRRTAKLKDSLAQAGTPEIPMPPFTPVSQGDMTDEPVQSDDVPPPQVRLEDLGNISEDDLQEEAQLEQQLEQPPEEVQPGEVQPDEDLRHQKFESITDAIAAAMQVNQVMTIEYTTKFGKQIGTRDI
jgi:uncharacterized membrane protein (UPF0127 family)